eukprot:scaffold8371_cov199-Amphora_coffeaeformis.AAC.8
MECEANNTSKQVGMEMLDLGDDLLCTILSFCDLPTISRVAQTNHCLHRLVQHEWCWRDASYYSIDQKSRRAQTARERLQRWAVGQSCLAQAMQTLSAVPKHVLVEPSEGAETMLRLFSVRRNTVLWEGFLPRIECNSSGWQLDVEPLQHVWRQMIMHPSFSSSLELLSQALEDLVVGLVIVDPSSTKAHLVTCTQGVALSQRQHTATNSTMPQQQQPPCTFVLRQQWVQQLPVVVHVALKADATTLMGINVSYFSAR